MIDIQNAEVQDTYLYDIREHCDRLSRIVGDQEVYAQLFYNCSFAKLR